LIDQGGGKRRAGRALIAIGARHIGGIHYVGSGASWAGHRLVKFLALFGVIGNPAWHPKADAGTAKNAGGWLLDNH
jgi:hypothetical protein